MTQRMVRFQDGNDGAHYCVKTDIVQGYSIVEIPAEENGIPIIGMGSQFELKLWVESRWWRLGRFDDYEAAKEVGDHVLGTAEVEADGA